MKKVYIAGKMSNIQYYNYPKFMQARDYLMSQGYEVHTPFEASNKIWQKHYGREFNPYTDSCEYGDPKMAEMLIEDLALCLSCDTIALLDDWTTSKGARLEIAAGFTTGKEFIYAATLERVQMTVDIYVTETFIEEYERTTHVEVEKVQ